MSGPVEGRRRRLPVPVSASGLLLLVATALSAGVILGRPADLRSLSPDSVVAEATLTDTSSWRTVVESDGLSGPREFDARSVAWVEKDGSLWGGHGHQEPPCLELDRPTAVELSYVALPHDGSVVTQVRCLAGG